MMQDFARPNEPPFVSVADSNDGMVSPSELKPPMRNSSRRLRVDWWGLVTESSKMFLLVHFFNFENNSLNLSTNLGDAPLSTLLTVSQVS